MPARKRTWRFMRWTRADSWPVRCAIPGAASEMRTRIACAPSRSRAPVREMTRKAPRKTIRKMLCRASSLQPIPSRSAPAAVVAPAAELAVEAAGPAAELAGPAEREAAEVQVVREEQAAAVEL